MKLYFSAFFFTLLSVHASAQSLYSLGGNTYEAKDLTPSQQQQLFDIQIESYDHTREAIDRMVLENYFDEEAKKQKKPREEVMNKVLDVQEPSEKDLKKWFEDNKSRIPPNYKFDQIKGEITKVIKQEKMKEKREILLEKIKKDRKFSLAIVKPISPIIDVKTDGFQSKGKDGAKVTVVEFADYQCPHCKTASETFKKVMEKMKDKVKFIFVDFPVNPSGISKAVAEASHCVAEQGKFWDFHYKAFETQATLEVGSADKLVKDLKLDETKFKACKDAGRGKTLVDQGKAEGDRIGVSGTPYILINSRRYVGANTVEAITKEIEAYLK